MHECDPSTSLLLTGSFLSSCRGLSVPQSYPEFSYPTYIGKSLSWNTPFLISERSDGTVLSEAFLSQGFSFFLLNWYKFCMKSRLSAYLSISLAEWKDKDLFNRAEQKLIERCMYKDSRLIKSRGGTAVELCSSPRVGKSLFERAVDNL